MTTDYDPGGERPRIRIGGTAETIRKLNGKRLAGLIPQIYVQDGHLVHVSEVSGSSAAAPTAEEVPPPLPVEAHRLSPPGLARLLAEHAETYKVRTVPVKGHERETVRQEHYEASPTKDALAAVLSCRHWPDVAPLYGIVGTPVLRPDGSLLQTAGYDEKTGLYFAPKTRMRPVPERPTSGQVAAAKTFLLRRLLADFKFTDDAGLPNYLGVLITPILRPYLGALVPLVLITATTQGSGKTLLAEIVGRLYGYELTPWAESDAELRKVITSVLHGPAAVLLWDNLDEGTIIDSGILAALLTAPEWTDRTLGRNDKRSRAVNDRVWIASGNNLRLGGDMATRTVRIGIDVGMVRPETRNDFVLGDLPDWIKIEANRTELLWNLLILVAAWMGAGAPRVTAPRMRQFSAWADAVAGFLAHHDIAGFLTNVEDVRSMDDADADWKAFLARWHALFGSEPQTAARILQSADIDTDSAGRPLDRWDGLFMTGKDDRKPKSARSLGMLLRGHAGRWHGDYVLRDSPDVTNKALWRVENRPQTGQEGNA